MRVEVTRYRKPDGYPSRYWAVMVDGELLVVTLYRKGAEAVAAALAGTDAPAAEPESAPAPTLRIEKPSFR